MPNSASVAARVWTAGLISGIVALAAIGVTMLAGNRNLGFGASGTSYERIFLFAVAVCITQIVLGLVQRSQTRRARRNSGR